MYSFVNEQWFTAMLSEGRSLPAELISYVDLSDAIERDEKIQISLKHIQRSFSLYQLDARSEDEDYEQVWWDVITLVEDVSYYCVMALPLLRYVIEEYCEVVPKLSGGDAEAESLEISEYWRKCFGSFDSGQRKFMNKLLKLSLCAKRLDLSFNRVSDASEFGKLSLAAYIYSSEVISLSTYVIKSKK